jgi:hypothetical protein
VQESLFKTGAVALLLCAGAARADHRVQPLIVTLDGRHHVTYSESIVVSPIERLVQAPELRMSACRRANAEPLAPGAYRLIHSAAGDYVDATAMRIEFGPTRVVLDTLHGDVRCDGEAKGYETGLDRIFIGHFEHG